MNCTQKQQLVSFPKVRIWKSWFRYFNNHKEFRNEGTVHLFSLMALFSYANFRSNERVINGERYMEAPGQWICKLGSLPRILRVHSKRQALEQLDYYEKYGFLTYEWLDEENEIIRFSITNWKEHASASTSAAKAALLQVSIRPTRSRNASNYERVKTMKKRITSLMLILVVAVSMTMGASATSYIPDDVTYQNLNGQQLAIKTYTLLPDQDPSDLYEDDFEYDGFLYSMSDIVKEEQRYQEENAHTEVVTVTTASKNLEDILAELKPTIEYDDGVSSGTLSLDHSTLKTEAAGYKRSSYTVTATKNYTGLDRNDSSYIDKTVEKNGRTLSLSNVTWSVESTALVGDELVPATYSAVATYSGSASSTVATGYITTAEYKGTVVSSGISSILYTVTYLGTKIEPTKAEPTFKGAVLVISIIGGTALLAALLFLGLTLRKNTTVYKATGKGNEYEKCGRLHLKVKNPELRIDRLKDIPEGVIAIEVDQAVAKKLFGQTIAIRCYDNTVEHTVGEVNGSYWFKVDIGSQEGESNYEEEP